MRLEKRVAALEGGAADEYAHLSTEELKDQSDELTAELRRLYTS